MTTPVPPDTTYTLDDLASALVCAHAYERSLAEELRDYHVTRGEAFRRAFGMVDREAHDRSERQWALRRLLTATISSRLSFSSPADGVMEAPRDYVVFADRFLPDIQRARAALNRELDKMLVALLEELVAPGRTTVTARELIANGFDPAREKPDPLDYW